MYISQRFLIKRRWPNSIENRLHISSARPINYQDNLFFFFIPLYPSPYPFAYIFSCFFCGKTHFKAVGVKEEMLFGFFICNLNGEITSEFFFLATTLRFFLPQTRPFRITIVKTNISKLFEKFDLFLFSR